MSKAWVWQLFNHEGKVIDVFVLETKKNEFVPICVCKICVS